MQAVRVIILAAAAVGLAVGAAPTAIAIPGYQPCPSPAGLQVEVLGGVSCEDSWVLNAYDFEHGDKYQEIANFACYSSTVDQKPIVLTCVSDQGELVVSAI